ncbi:MAG: ABC transporter ATP-binding protein [Lachnospiraceae bacterium]
MLEKKAKKNGQTKEKRRITAKTLRFMLKTAWQQKPTLFLLYFIRLVADVALKLQAVILPKFLFDELVLLAQEANAHAAYEQIALHFRNAAFYALLTALIVVIANLLNNIVENLKGVYSEWFNEYFEVMLSDHAMQMDYEHTEDPKALDQIGKAKDGISWYSGGVTGILDPVYTVVMNLIVLASVLTVILMTCPLLIPIQLISLLFITVLNAKINKIEAESYMALSKINRVCGYVLWELADFKYGKEIRLYESADMMCHKAEVLGDEQTALWKNNEYRQRGSKWGMDVVNSLRDGISYFYIGYLAVKRVITIGDFSMCVAAASSLYWSLDGIVRAIQRLIQHCNYAYEFLVFLDYPAAMPKGTKKVCEGKHEIEFRHVSFRYPRSEKEVLHDINLKITSGEHLSIVGLNGAGKTTFIKLLCRLYDVTEGEILIDGINIKEYSEEEYRKLFAVVFQDFQLLAFSLKDNIVLGEKADEEKLNEVLKLSGLYEDAMKLKNGVDTILYKGFDEDGTDLSGGQKQKTAISRALYKNAPIVILDEPTAALDPVAEYEIYRQFNSLVGGKTAIYISHRLSSCKFCDRIAVFAEDTIKEYGTHEELVGKQNGIYATMFATQAQYYVENAGQAV